MTWESRRVENVGWIQGTVHFLRVDEEIIFESGHDAASGHRDGLYVDRLSCSKGRVFQNVLALDDFSDCRSPSSDLSAVALRGTDYPFFVVVVN